MFEMYLIQMGQAFERKIAHIKCDVQKGWEYFVEFICKTHKFGLSSTTGTELNAVSAFSGRVVISQCEF